MTSNTLCVPSSSINSGCNIPTPVSMVTTSTFLPVKEYMTSLFVVSAVVIPTPLYGVDVGFVKNK